MFEQELSGVTFENSDKKPKSRRALAREKRTKKVLEQRFIEWEAENKKRECI